MGVCAGDAEPPLLSSNGATCPSLYSWTEIKSRETPGEANLLFWEASSPQPGTEMHRVPGLGGGSNCLSYPCFLRKAALACGNRCPSFVFIC